MNQTIKVSLAKPEDKEEWNRFVDENGDSKIFHRYEWGEMLKEAYNHEPHYLIARKGSETHGVFPLIHINSRLFGSRLISVPFGDYGGPSLRDNSHILIKKILEETTSLMDKLDVEYTEIRGTTNTLTDHLTEANVQDVRYCTFNLDLTRPIKEIWTNFNKKVRNATRKAERNNIRLINLSDKSELERYYELYLRTMKSLGSPPHSLSFFIKMWEALHHKGMLQILLARHKDQNVGGIILLRYKEKIHFWSSVLHEEHRSLNPTNYLLWQAIQKGKERGYKIFDFGRTRSETGVYRFKARWGGIETKLSHLYLLNRRGNPNIPDPERTKYKFLSKIWRQVPVSLAKRVGPRIISGIGL